IAFFRTERGRRRKQASQSRIAGCLCLGHGIYGEEHEKNDEARPQRMDYIRPMQISSAVRRIAAAVLLAMVSVPGAAQNAEPPNPLTSVKGLKCRFPSATSATWKNG